jgi:hypothetical protein
MSERNDPIIARRRVEAEQARQEHEQREAAQRGRDELAATGNLVETLGRDFELEQKADKAYLNRWVEAMGAYKSLFKLRMLKRLKQSPAGLTEHGRDAWQTAVDIFLAADTDPARAMAMLEDVAKLPDFAVSVARWLRRGIRGQAEGYRLDGLASVVASPKNSPVLIPDPPSPEGGSATEPAAGTVWQDVQRRLERLRSQGEPWTSCGEMAERFSCSTQTVHKAIHATPELTLWTKKPDAAPRAQQGLDEVVTDRAAIHGEPDPTDDVADAELRKVFEEADPDERAFLHGLRGASREYQLWYIQQPGEVRKKHRKLRKRYIETDVTMKTWFLGLPLEEQLAFLDDPGRYQKTLPRP